MADYGTIKVNKVTYKNGSDADTDFNFKTDIVSATSPDFTTDITLKSQAPVKFEDDSGGEYVGLKAPTGVTTYTVTLPAAAPSNGQVLKATSATALGWSADTTLSLLDEDNFSSDSATAAASQQSIKAYGAATYQALDADTAKTDVDQEFTKPQRGHVEVATHSSGTDYNFDLDAHNNWKLTISAGVKLNFTNLDASREGQTGTIYVDNTGAVTPTWGDEVQFEGGTVLSITQSAKSLLAYYVLPGGADVLVTAILDVKDD